MTILPAPVLESVGIANHSRCHFTGRGRVALVDHRHSIGACKGDMVGIVVVGDPKGNLDSVIASYRSNPKLSDKAKDKLALLLERVKTGG